MAPFPGVDDELCSGSTILRAMKFQPRPMRSGTFSQDLISSMAKQAGSN
jgi:hypothetical protein